MTGFKPRIIFNENKSTTTKGSKSRAQPKSKLQPRKAVFSQLNQKKQITSHTKDQKIQERSKTKQNNLANQIFLGVVFRTNKRFHKQQNNNINNILHHSHQPVLLEVLITLIDKQAGIPRLVLVRSRHSGFLFQVPRGRCLDKRKI